MTFDKIKSMLSDAAGNIKGKASHMGKPITAVVVGYMVLLIILILSYYAAWLYNILCKGQVVLNDMYILIHELTGTSMIACITFIGGCFVDMDGDGVPDVFEKDKK